MRDAREIARSMEGIASTILIPAGLYPWFEEVTEEDESNPLTERMSAFRDAYHASVLTRPMRHDSPSRMDIGDPVVREVIESLCYQLLDNPEAQTRETGAARTVLVHLRTAGLLTRKRCTRCDVVKPMTEYAWLFRSKGVRRPDCLECQRQRFREYRRERRGERLSRYTAPVIARTVETDAWEDEDVYCPGCDRSLPREAFHKHKRAANGLQPRCKECANARRRERSVKGTA